MAIVASNQEIRAKLVYQYEDDGGETRQTSRTFSNLQAGAGNDALYAGLAAVAGLLDATGVSLVRVDESTLVSE